MARLDGALFVGSRENSLSLDTRNGVVKTSDEQVACVMGCEDGNIEIRLIANGREGEGSPTVTIWVTPHQVGSLNTHQVNREIYTGPASELFQGSAKLVQLLARKQLEREFDAQPD